MSALPKPGATAAVRTLLLIAAAAALLIAIIVERPPSTPGPPMRDFEAYYAAGKAYNIGANPYGAAIWRQERMLPGVVRARFEVLPFVGPPATLPLFALLARLPFSQANALWRSFLITALSALALLAMRFAHVRIGAFAVCAAAIAVLGFGPATSALALGQVALPAAVLSALAVAAITRRPAVGSILSALAWIQPNVAVPMFAATRNAKGLIAMCAGIAVFAAGSLRAIGLHGLISYAARLHAHSIAERFAMIQTTPAAIAYGFGASAPAAAGAGLLIAVAAIVTWLAIAGRRNGTLSRFCAGCSLLPFAMPFFHEQDMIVLFIPAVFCVLRVERHIAPFAVAGALLCAADWLGLAQRPAGGVQTLLLVGAAALALLLLRAEVDTRSVLAACGVLCCIAAASIAAAHDPAPIWPDAMTALPHAVHGLPIAQIWHAEQRASGLLRPNALWAGLRCLPLVGAALLTCACARSRELDVDVHKVVER